MSLVLFPSQPLVPSLLARDHDLAEALAVSCLVILVRFPSERMSHMPSPWFWGPNQACHLCHILMHAARLDLNSLTRLFLSQIDPRCDQVLPFALNPVYLSPTMLVAMSNIAANRVGT